MGFLKRATKFTASNNDCFYFLIPHLSKLTIQVNPSNKKGKWKKQGLKDFKYWIHHRQIMLRTKLLMNCSLLPQSPLLWKGCLLCEKPPLGALSLKGHKKLLASLKCGPTLQIWLTKSSTQTIPFLPKTCSMTALLVKGILCLLTLP